MSLTSSIGTFLGIPGPSARFLLALFSAFPFALAYRRLIATQAAQVQNLYFTLTGMWIMYYVYGTDIWHSLVDITVVYLLFVTCGGTLLCLTLTWIVTMGHLITGYASVMLSDQVHPISWTIPHCVLVLKLIGLSFNLYDARKKEEELHEDFKKHVVHNVPSFLEITGYSYFCGTVLAGPQFPFIKYQKFINGELYDSRTTPSNVPAAAQRFLVAVLYAVLYSVLNRYFPINYLATDGFADEPFVRKLWLVFISSRVVLWRYVTVWLFAETSCIFTGVAYRGTDSEGRVKWDAVSNVRLIKFEFTRNFADVIGSFNINTTQWISWYAFKRLRWLGNKCLSYMITFLFVILWHGLWPGYFICFILEFLDLMAMKTFVDYAKNYLGYSLSNMHAVIRMPLSLISHVLTYLMMGYAIIFFMLLTWVQCYKFLSATYFYGCVILIVWGVFYIVMTRIVHKRRNHLHVE